MVATIAFVAFLPALRGEFLSWDDERNFVANPHYRGLGLEQLKWMWSTFLLGHYIPITWMTLGLDYTLWGMNPAGYHLTNLLLHAANAILVYLLARRLFGLAGAVSGRAHGAEQYEAAAIAALFFSVHPLRVESVAWVTERRDVLSAFFFLGSALSYLRAVSAPELRRGAYWAAVALFVCAVLSKATVVTLPAVLLILNVYPLRRLSLRQPFAGTSRRVLLEMIPFAIPAAAGLVISVVAVHPPFLDKFGLSFLAPRQLSDLAANVSAQNQFGLPAKLAVSAFSLAFYLLKTVLPTGLSPLYEMPRSIDPASARFVLSYIAVLVIAAGCLFWRRYPGMVAALACFFVISLPMLGIVQNGPQIAADRYTYHAAPALALLAAGALWHALRGRNRRAFLAVGGGISAILAAVTWRQSTYWQNTERLWSRVLAIDSASSLGHSAMASLRYKQNRVEEGLAHSLRSLELAPDFAEAHNDFGVGLARQGKPLEALAEYRRALALKPRFDDAENNLGVLMMQLGQADSAVWHYQRALDVNPDNADAEINWGNALVRSGRTAEAIERYRRAVWIRPTAADAYHNWGVALAREGRFKEAVERFQMALGVDPDHAEARVYLEQAAKLAGSPR